MNRSSEGHGRTAPDHTYGLEELSGAVKYRRYLFDLLAPHCSGTILEVGAGTGDFAAQFPPDQPLILTDSDPRCVRSLRARFKARPSVSVSPLDLAAPTPGETVGSAIAINVLEHIDDDVGALESVAARVAPGGRIVVFVPGYPALYGPFDDLVGHVRRYTPASLTDAVRTAGLEVALVKPVNFIGGIAWWLAVKLGKRTRPDPRLVRLYDRLLVPLVRLIERRWTPPFGQSVMCVARVPSPRT